MAVQIACSLERAQGTRGTMCHLYEGALLLLLLLLLLCRRCNVLLCRSCMGGCASVTPWSRTTSCRHI